MAGACEARGVLERLVNGEDSLLSPVVFNAGVRVVWLVILPDWALFNVGADDLRVGSSRYLSGKEATAGATRAFLGGVSTWPTHGCGLATPHLSRSS